MRHAQHHVRNERGAAIIELAVAAPLLIIMVFAVIQFSLVLHNKVVLAESVGFAARTLAMQRGATDPCGTTVTKLKAALGTAIASSAQITVTVHGSTYGPSNSPACGGNVGTSMLSGEDAVLRATYPWSIGVYGISLGPGTLASQVTVRVE